MKFIIDKVHTKVEGNFVELNTLRNLLTVLNTDTGEGDCLLSDSNTILTGIINRVFNQLDNIGILYTYIYNHTYERVDPRTVKFYKNILPGIELYDYQVNAGRKFICNGGRGLLDLATGAGKTEIACALTKYYDVPTLFMTDRVLTMGQTAGRYSKYGMKTGCFGGEDRVADSQVVVGVVDSLANGIRRQDDELMYFMKHCEFLIADEVHHLPSDRWSFIAEHCHAPRRIGLSASAFGDPDDLQYEDMVLIGHTGEVCCSLQPRWLIDHGRCKACGYEGLSQDRKCPKCGGPGVGYLAEPLIHMIKVPCGNVAAYDWHPAYQQGIVENNIRNVVAVGLARIMAENGFKVLMLINRIEHGEKLLRMIDRPNCIFSSGGGNFMKINSGLLIEESRDPEQVRQEFDDIKGGAILIGSSVYDEGVDLPSMNCLIMAQGMKARRKTIQRIGRPLHSKDDFVYIFDFWDSHNPILFNHSVQRKSLYEQLQYKVTHGYEFVNQRLGLTLDTQKFVLSYARSQG